MLRFAVLTLVCAAAFGQEQTRTFTFAHAQSPQQMGEVVNTVRSIGEIRNVSVDALQRTITVGGTADQLAFASWLFTDLDKPAGASTSLVIRENLHPDPRASAVRIFYLSRVSTPVQLQELVNAIRSIAELQRVVPMTATAAIVARGEPNQIALAEWIVREIDQAAGGTRPREVRKFQFEDTHLSVERRTPAVRIYYPASLSTPMDMQETVNGLRSVAEVQRVVVITASGAIVSRSSDDQAALTDWLVKELDKGASAAGPSDYSWRGGTVRSAWLAKGADLAATTAQVRQATGMQRVVSLTRQRAIVMRGTPAQIAAAEPLLR
jgi:hypothetical protein